MKRAEATLAVDRRMLAWIDDGGRPERASAGQRLQLRWASFWFERNLRLQRRLVPAAPLAADPLFVMGLWRSGTTLAHELLASGASLRAPATWQCLDPSSFRLRAAPRREATALRPMDGMQVTTLSPQEDEFALLALGVPSAYRGFFDPRRLPEFGVWLDPANWEAERPAGWLDAWREFLSWVAGDHPGRLVLKSPNHTFRIRAIAAAFPDARHIWLVRDPAQTFLSNRKMWKAMFTHYALWPWDEALLDAFLVGAMDAGARALALALQLYPRERLCVLDFDELAAHPAEALLAALAQVGLARGREEADALRRSAALRPAHRPEQYGAEPLAAAAQESLARLQQGQQQSLASHGLRGPAQP